MSRQYMGSSLHASRISALFWRPKKSMERQELDSVLGQFTLTESVPKVFSFSGPLIAFHY